MSGKKGQRSKKATTVQRGTKGMLAPMDRRTRAARMMRDAKAVLLGAFGDDLSPQENSLLDRIVYLEALLRSDEQKMLRGDAAFDRGTYRADINALVGLYRTVGIKRRAKTVKRLHELLTQDEPHAQGAVQ